MIHFQNLCQFLNLVNSFMASELPKLCCGSPIVGSLKMTSTKYQLSGFFMFTFCWENKFLIGQSKKFSQLKLVLRSWKKMVKKISGDPTKFWWFGCHEWVVNSFIFSNSPIYFLQILFILVFLLNFLQSLEAMLTDLTIHPTFEQAKKNKKWRK